MRQRQRRRQHGDRQWAENTLYTQVSNERLANAFWETLLNYSTHLNISTAHFKSYMNIHYLYVCTHIVLIICPNVLRCRYIKVMQVFLGICLKQVFIWQHFRVRLFFVFVFLEYSNHARMQKCIHKTEAEGLKGASFRHRSMSIRYGQADRGRTRRDRGVSSLLLTKFGR